MKRTTVSERTLVLAPRGRDAAIAVALLAEAGFAAESCPSPAGLLAELDRGAAVVVATEEALAEEGLGPLARWIAEQEEWSDLPFVLLTGHGGGPERNPVARRHLDMLGNVTFVERPFHPTTLVSAVRSALRGRRRQYEARARLEALRESERRYRALFESIDEGFCVIAFLDGPEGPLSDYVHIEANPAYERHAGIPDIVGKRLRKIVAPAEADAWAARYRAVLVTGEPVRFERELVETGRHLELAAFRVGPFERRQVAVLFQDVTPRRRAEADLRASEARFRAAVDAVEGIVWTNDARGEMTGEQAGWAALTGQSRDEYQGFGWAAAVHPDDARPTVEAWTAAVAERRTFTFEHRVRRHDGVWRRFSVRAIPVLNEAGAVGAWVGVHTDVTEQRLAEDRLRELNDRLEARVAEALAERALLATIVETTDVLVQVLDLSFRWLAINSACADAYDRIFGKRPAVGTSLLDLLADKPEQLAAAKAVWSRALAGEAFTQTGEFGDPAHDLRTYEMKFEVLRGPDGRRIGAFLTGIDVTERVREQRRLAEAEAARRRSDALYRAYFENTPEALFVVRVEDESRFFVEEINPAHEAGVGLALRDIRDRAIEDILPAPMARRVLETYRHVVRTGAIYQYREEFEFSGVARHWDTSLVPMRDETGRVVRLIGSSRDVTRQVQAEEALRQSQKMEAMGQLTGGVAHDFNNLLTPIVGTLDMLQRKGVGADREQRLIAGAAQSAERARVLVQRLLAFARRQPLQPVGVDVGRLVSGMADLIASTTGPQIRVQVEIADDLPPAKADPNQLEMALLNLAVNARDAMPDGGVLRIAAAAEALEPVPFGSKRSERKGPAQALESGAFPLGSDDSIRSGNALGGGSEPALPPGTYVRLTIADTGIGMDEATLVRAIEPFFSTKGVGKGTGLGLSMAHGLASQLGGALTIASRPGHGTTVHLWLPETRDVTQASPGPPDAVGAPGRGTALLVDDEEVVRLSTADMLADLGFRVIEASSGEEALSLIGNETGIDLVVTDHLMPGMSGTDLARSLRDRHPDLLVLVVSGYAEVDDVAPDFPRLTKPFRRDELAACLAGLPLQS